MVLSGDEAVQRTSTGTGTKETLMDNSSFHIDGEGKNLHPAISVGLGTFMVLNVGMMLSLPPVLMGRGAPYLPTFQKSMNAMFRQLRNSEDFKQKVKDKRLLQFVDLGSGDGRIVFRASQENFFEKCIGYEINPLLHLFAKVQRILRGPKYWASTDFFLKDIWKADLRKVDVIAVYGLGPIMKDLGAKLEDEMQPGSLVMSNVFSIPGWHPVSSSDGTYIYVIRGKSDIGAAGESGEEAK